MRLTTCSPGSLVSASTREPPSKIHFYSESKHHSAMYAAPDVGVVLNDRLHKQHGQGVYQRIEFHATLVMPALRTNPKKPRAQSVLHEAQRHRVMDRKRHGRVEP